MGRLFASAKGKQQKSRFDSYSVRNSIYSTYPILERLRFTFARTANGKRELRISQNRK